MPAVLGFLKARAITGVEVVKDDEYMRTVRMVCESGEPVYGWVRVKHTPQNNTLSVTIGEALLPVLPQVLARIRHLFDLYCDPMIVYETLQVMNDIRPGLCILGTRVPGCFNAFEMAVRAVLGQQITVKAAGTLAARIVEKYGIPVQTGIPTHIFPLPEQIAAMGDEIRENFGVLGVISVRSDIILELAQALLHGDIKFDLCASPDEEMKKLMKIRGIGGWTAKYIAMRAME